MRTVKLALRRPGTTLALAAFLLIAVIGAYGKLGHGVEFFPKVEPDYGQVIVHGRGNLSLDEKDKAVRQVEKSVLATDGLKTVYTRVGEQPRGSSEITEDTIGVIQFEFADWQTRPPAHEIMDAIRAKTADIPGILVEVTAPRAGPPTGKPIQVQLSAINPDQLPAAAKKVAAILATRSDIRDLDDGLPLPGIDWKIEVDKAEAAKYGASVGIVGTAVQLVTNGVKVTEYRPSDSDKAVDIIVRFPGGPAQPRPDRRIARPDAGRPRADRQFRQPRAGPARRLHQPRQRQSGDDGLGQRRRRRAERQGAAGDRPGARPDRPRPRRAVEAQGRGRGARQGFGAFLLKAFGTAMFLIFAILLAQFNKLTSVVLVLTAVVLSTIGVLLGLLIMGQAFGVVMTGIGIIANAGVIVNNNIVLIDTYDRLRREGKPAYEAIIETCRERARPVVLTAVTAILGVLPIAFGINLEFSGARGHGRRAVDAMVDQPVDGDRVRPRLCDDPDPDRDAGGVDGDCQSE